MPIRLAALRGSRSVLSASKAFHSPAVQQLIRFSTSKPAVPQTAHLEVERKFNFNEVFAKHLQEIDERGGNPIAHSDQGLILMKPLFVRRPSQRIIDEYFDSVDALSARGIWVRKRTSSFLTSRDSKVQWEAKVRLGGDYQNSEFEELVGEDEVKEVVEKLVSFDNLIQTLQFSTIRQSWDVQEHVPYDNVPFQALVVVDICTSPNEVLRIPPHQDSDEPGQQLSFLHEVGEVELTRDVELTGDEVVDKQVKMDATAELRDELKEWMDRHDEFFPTHPPPQGKITAFQGWKKLVSDFAEQLKRSGYAR